MDTESILQQISNLSSSGFLPHGHSFLWIPGLIVLHSGTDILMGVSLLAISVLLYRLVRRHKLPFTPLLLAFCCLIALSGVTHFMEVWNLWNGNYWEQGILKGFAALASVATVVWLFVSRRKISALVTESTLANSRKNDLEKKNRELGKAYNKILESERLKDQFLASVSQDLRTPLTMILAPVEGLLGDRNTLNEVQRSLLKKVHNNAVRLLQMVVGLLDHARLDAKKYRSSTDSFDVVKLVQQLMTEFQPLIEQRGLNIETRFSSECLPVKMDRYILERVIFNLVSNAIKFTPAGGSVGVIVRDEGPNKLEILIKDSGIGIPDGIASSIFEKFRQWDSSSVRRFEGLGLGLALVKEFVDLAGGHMELESRPGFGTQFRLHFNYQIPEGKLDQSRGLDSKVPRFLVEKPDDAIKSANLPLVVIVQENRDLSDYIKEILGTDYRTKTAINGEEAVHMIFSEPPVLVLSDVLLPIMNGIELTKRLRRDERTSFIPILLLSALTGREDIIRGWEAGCDDYLFKPFHPTELKIRVKTLVDLYMKRIEREEILRKSAQESSQQYFAPLNLVAASKPQAPDRASTQVWELLRTRDDIVRAAVSTLRQNDSLELQIVADKLELALVKGDENVVNRKTFNKPNSPMEGLKYVEKNK